jgi:hypothetical protein
MRMPWVLAVASLCLAACADPLPGDWEMRRGWCIDDMACEYLAIVDYPVVREDPGCTLTETGHLNITDDLDGAFTFLFSTEGEACASDEQPIRFEVTEIEELEKDSFYQIDVDFGQATESLDCRLVDDDARLTCVGLHTQDDLVFER